MPQGNRRKTKKRMNFCSIIRAMNGESDGDVDKLSLEFFSGEIVLEKVAISS